MMPKMVLFHGFWVGGLFGCYFEMQEKSFFQSDVRRITNESGGEKTT